MDFRIIAIIEASVLAIFIVWNFISYKLRDRKISKMIESKVYDMSNAKDNTLMNFPLPIAALRVDDSYVVWGNEQFYEMCGVSESKMDVKVCDFLPDFSGKWLLEGRTLYPSVLDVNGKKYRIHGNLVRSNNDEDTAAFLGLTYWVDVSDYDNLKTLYEESRLVLGIVVIDNLDEITKNQPDRIINDIMEEVEDRLDKWASEYGGIIRRYNRDRYICLFEKNGFNRMKADSFKVIEKMHSIENNNGVAVSLSIGFGEDAQSLQESLQFADMSIELALTRGGDQAVIKNRFNFEFFGGRGLEVEKRTKVKSRVMANTLKELIKDSSRVIVMSHKYEDYDSIGAAVGVCIIARKFGVRYNIAADLKNNAATPLINALGEEDIYKGIFMNPRDALIHADGKTLLVIVDTNRPEQVEDADLLEACNRVAVIDHHRVAATYIHNAALAFIEPYSSSTCELMSEILQEITEKNDIQKFEADALLSGIVLDTKNFTIRTGERTFDAAAYLRHCGADTTDVKRLMQSNIDDTIKKYNILTNAELYRKVAIAIPTDPQTRVIVASAADELLNISGVDASIVIAPGENGGVFASARSIGELNVQIIMETLGGGGNRSAAAVQFADISLEDAVERVYRAIDDYLDK